MSDVALKLTGVVRTFRQAGAVLEVLRGVDLSIAAGEMIALVGPSGAGKSTLLQIAGVLEAPDDGDVIVGGQSSRAMNEQARTVLRRNRLGFVYQFHHLLPEFSAAENVMLPQMIAGASRGAARQRAEELLASVGLAERASHRPSRLSGGEQQRVAIVRAIANDPNVLLADEPTGNLDPVTADGVFGQLQHLVRETGLAALIATHNLDLARRMDRTLSLQDGRVVELAV
jgi:lipoprotein-releasing system ATP-binding protein